MACAVIENFSEPQGAATDPLLAAAVRLADGGTCPALALGAQELSAGRKARLAASDQRDGRGQGLRLDERSDMLDR